MRKVKLVRNFDTIECWSSGWADILMYEIHVQRWRKISMRASGQPSYIDIIVIALLEMSVVIGGGVCVWPGMRVFGRRVSGRTWLGRAEGVESRRHYAKEMVSSVIPGSRWPEVVAFGTSCGIVSARLSASNGRARASRASKSDGCSALLKRISYISQARSMSGPPTVLRYSVRS